MSPSFKILFPGIPCTTSSFIDYYSSQGIIANINGQQSIEKVFEDIVNALGCEK